MKWLDIKPITHAGYIVNGPIALMTEPEFGAQASDEDVQVLPFILVFRTPDLAQKVRMGEHLSSVKHQFLEEVKLSGRQSYFVAGHGYPPSGKVYLKAAALEGIAGLHGESSLTAAEHCSYPG